MPIRGRLRGKAGLERLCSALVRAGFDFGTAVTRQISLAAPGGEAHPVTNDGNDYYDVSVSGGEQAIAAVRFNRYANVWLADAIIWCS